MRVNKVDKDVVRFAADQYGNYMSKNLQAGTDEMLTSIDLFQKIYEEKINVALAQKKGNYFEFLETLKFNQNAANVGAAVRARTTHADGRPHDPVDVEILVHGKVVDKAQLKASNASSYDPDAYMAFVNADKKYAGMQRVVPKDKYDRVRELTKNRANSQGIYKEEYQDSYNNMTGELTDRITKSGVSSKGTTTKELNRVNRHKDQYFKEMKLNQYKGELLNTSVNSALANGVITAIVSGVENFYAVFQNKKSLEDGLKDLGIDVVRESGRGLVTGGASTALRIGAKEKLLPALSQDGTYAVTMAGSMVDCGCLLYSYARGEIDADELCDGLVDTSVKTASTIFISKAVELAIGKTSMFVPLTIYTLASYVVANTREILRNAKLNAEAYAKMEAFYNEAAQQEKVFRKQLELQMDKYIADKRVAMDTFINQFTQSMTNGNYDGAVYAIVGLSNKFGVALKYVDFTEFDQMMISDGDLKI